MTLATRCTFCGTAFRVVEDQLKVSHGWVRCGRCNQVFNGREGLIELEAPAPQSGPQAPSPAPPAAPAVGTPDTKSPEPLPETGPFRIGLVGAPGTAAGLRAGDGGVAGVSSPGAMPAAQADEQAPSMGALLARESAPGERAPPVAASGESEPPVGAPGESPAHAPSQEPLAADAPSRPAGEPSPAGQAAGAGADEPSAPEAAMAAPAAVISSAAPTDSRDLEEPSRATSEPESTGAGPLAPSGPTPAEPLTDSSLDTSPEIHVVFAAPAEAAIPTRRTDDASGDAGNPSSGFTTPGTSPWERTDAPADATPLPLAAEADEPSGSLGAPEPARALPGTDPARPRIHAASEPELTSDDDAGSTANASAPGDDLPTFLQTPERPSRWQSRRARALLVGLVVAGGLVLLGQVVHHFRDAIAARSPAARGALEAWCAMAGCRIEAPRAIDPITLDSSTLLRDPTLDAFRLAVTLRSRAVVALATPSFDLRLTDSAGALVARRVLAPRELGAPPLLQPGGELSLQALLAVREPRVTGYTVEIFYP